MPPGVAAPDVAPLRPLPFRLAQTPVLRELMRFVTPRWLFVSGLRSAFYDPSRATPEMIDQYWRLNLRPGTREANLARFTCLSISSRPRSWATLLWGREDKLIPVANARGVQDGAAQVQAHHLRAIRPFADGGAGGTQRRRCAGLHRRAVVNPS